MSISVIVCSRQSSNWTLHQDHIARTIGCEYEYIRIDNSSNRYGICQAYEMGLAQAQFPFVVFVHEDVFFLERGWGITLLDKFVLHEKAVALGVAGSQVIIPEQPSWASVGQPWIKGKVLHHRKSVNQYILCSYGDASGDVPVVALDGLFMAFRRNVFNYIAWDHQNFDGFHLYDLDICMQARRYGSILVTEDILLIHQSEGHFDQAWWSYAEKFTVKHFQSLPAIQFGVNWSPGEKHQRFESYDLTDRLKGLQIP